MASMPICLITSTSVLFAFVQAQHLQSQNFRGSSQGYQAALTFSAFFGFIALIGVIVFYFFQATWYWPLLLFFLTGALGSLVLVIFRAIFPEWLITLIAFIAWPACAIWAIYIVHGIAP